MSKENIKKPEYTPEELNSNIAYGMTSVNNITQDELNSIQWLCEKSMNDNIKIKKLQQQLKDNTKQVCEKNKKELSNVGKTYFEDEPYIEICIVKGILDQIEKEEK